MRKIPPPFRFWIAAAGLSLFPLAGPAADWWFEAGPLFRGGMRLKTDSGSYTENLGLHATPSRLSFPAGVGSKSELEDRIYRDGYVKLDSGTLDPSSVGGAGNTWNWAYDKRSQYNAAANTLSFHQQGGPGYAALVRGSSGSDELWGAGMQVNAGYPVWRSAKWSLDLGAGFQGVWGAESRLDLTSYRERVSRQSVADRYNVGAATDPSLGFPPPQTVTGGYHGTFDGPAGGASSWAGGFPTIRQRPDARNATRQDLSTAENAISYRVDTDFYEVTFNPRLRYAATSALSLHVTPKLGVGYVDLAAERSELFADSRAGLLGSWKDRASEGSWHFTAGLTAGADIDFGRGFYGGVFGGYEWAVDDARFAIGPNHVSLDASGFVAGLMFGKRF